MSENRAQVKALIERRGVLAAEQLAVQGALQAELDVVLQAEAKQVSPRTKNYLKVLGKERIDALSAPFIERYKALDYAAQFAAIEADIKALAVDAVIEPGEFRLWKVVYVSNYRSQGFGAERYAEGAAKLCAAEAEAAGVPARVVEQTEKVHQFVVEVAVADRVDIEILNHKPGLTLREWVRRSWGQGTNPRVFIPSLPHGYEESVGLDYFGREKEVHA